MLKKNWLIFLLTMLTMLVLAACGGESEEADVASDSGEDATETASEGGTLNLLVWEGFADPAIISDYEEEYGVKVNAVYFGSSDELLAKLKSGGGSTYDLVSPSGDLSGLLVQENMLEPINTESITNYADIDDSLKVKEVEKDGEVYGVPYVWGPNYLIYDADVISEPIKSWNDFADSKYAGQLSLSDDINNLYIAGQALGVDNIYNMSEEELQEAKALVETWEPQVRKYWATAGELNDLFANKEVALAVGWPLTVKQINDQGRNLKWAIPEEGTTGWMDHYMIVKGSKNKKNAELFIDYSIRPEIQAKTAEALYYAPVNLKAKEFMSEDVQEATNINDMEGMFSKIDFWQYVEDRNRYNEIWTEIKTN